MKPKWSGSRPRVLRAIGVASAVVTCAYDREPTGVPDVRGTQNASQGGVVYAEERRAVELAREIPGLAGFYLDTAGNVVVAIKDRGQTNPSQSLLRSKFQRELARARVRHPSADVLLRGATYSFLELKEWRDRLMNANILSVPGVVWLDLDEVQNHVVIGLDVGADAVGPRVVAQSLGVPAEAVEVDVTGPYVSQQTLRDEFRPVQGGIQIQRVSGTSRVACTLGFTAMRSNEQVFLTAGHCSPNVIGTDSVAQFQPLAPLTHADSATMSPIGREILQFSEPCGSRRCSYSDAALYGLVPSPAWGFGRIAQPVSGCFPGPCNPPVLNIGPTPYWVIDTTYQGFVVNDLVSKIGSATGWSQGSVSRTCVDVSPSSSVTYRCQMFATYGADDGDSGAPILLDIQGGADSTVTLGGIHSGRSGSNRVFSPWSGIVQDYGSLSVVPVAQQPNWPLLVDTPPQLDTTRLIQLPSGRFMYRTNIQLRFKDGVSDSAKAAFFTRHGMTVVGVTRSGHFFVGIPDPGQSLDSLFALLDTLNQEPEVLAAASVDFSPLREIRDYRYPVDGPGQARSDWVSTTSTWAMRAIRAPLAWGCETGTYGGSLPAVGLFEWKHQANHPEFARSSPVLWEPPDAPLAFRPAPSQAVIDSNQAHATATTGLLAAEGNNVSGIAGVNWQTGLHLYAGYSSPGNHSLPIPDNFFALADGMVRHRLRVLSLSADAAVDSTKPVGDRQKMIQVLAGDIQRDLLDSLPSLLVVVAAGNDRYRGTDSAYARDNKAAVIRAALLLVRSNPAYRDRILVVAGTMPGNTFWDTWTANTTQGSNFYTGATEIAAPAQDVTVLDRWTGQTGSAVPLRVATGTSLSAPLVAGVAAQLLTVDPSLTAAQVKSYILRGARQPRPDSQTGQIAPPPTVTGAPEPVYQLDAYGALTLLASERSGIPLCGNRVWVASTQLVAQRDTGAAPQVLADIGDTAAFVNVHHGGRRVDVWTDDFDPLSFVFNQGAWTVSGTPPASPDGGAWNSLWSLSHDGDTAVTVVNHSGSNPVTLEVRRGPTGGSSTKVADIPVPLASSGDFVCIYIDGLSGECHDQRFVGTSEFVSWWTAAYSPLGDRVIVSVSTSRIQTTSVGGMGTCPWEAPGPTPSQCRTHIDYSTQTIGTTYHQIDLRTGNDTALATPATAPVVVFWSALAEDGGQLVTGEGVMSQTSRVVPDTSFPGFNTFVTSQATTACTLRYRQASSGLAPLFVTASEDVCRGPLGGGSMAPAPPITSRTQ